MNANEITTRGDKPHRQRARRGKRLLDETILDLARILEDTVRAHGSTADAAGPIRQTMIIKLAIENAEAAKLRGEIS